MCAVIALDIGGTNIKYAIVNNGNPIYGSYVKTAQGDSFIRLTESIILELLNKANNDGLTIEGIGIGCPGIISHDGTVRFSNNIKLNDFPLAKQLREEFNIPVRITNDANAAALAEFHYGAGRHCADMAMLTVGTGVGFALILDGKLQQGFQGGAAGGHMVIKQGGRLCNCGNKGCLEQYASMTALLRDAKHYAAQSDSVLSGKEIDGIMLFTAVKNGDKAAKQAYDRFLKHLAAGIVTILNVIRPQIIVIGGGISEQGDYLINGLMPLCETTFAQKSIAPYQIKTAELKNTAGILGASLLFKA